MKTCYFETSLTAYRITVFRVAEVQWVCCEVSEKDTAVIFRVSDTHWENFMFFMNRALWYTYVRRTNKMATYLLTYLLTYSMEQSPS